MIIQVIVKYLHQLMLMLHLFEWLCNMLLFHPCQQENCFEWNLRTRSCSMDRKEREPNLIRLANWIWRVTSVIPEGQQVEVRTDILALVCVAVLVKLSEERMSCLKIFPVEYEALRNWFTRNVSSRRDLKLMRLCGFAIFGNRTRHTVKWFSGRI